MIKQLLFVILLWFGSYSESYAECLRDLNLSNEVVTLEHDVCGRVTKRTITQNGFRPKTWIFEWNAMDQMVSTTTPEGEIWAYAYDPFGRRVLKECKAKSLKTEFIWDGDVLAFEINGNQKVEWFYEPNSFRPLARREGSNLHYIVNDHLGTPKEAFTERGSLVWSVDHHTWGTVKNCWMSATLDKVDDRGEYLGEGYDGQPAYSAKSGNNALAYAASSKADPLFVPIRFQGQYEDAETGLFYNRHRYYEPKSGNYFSKDPAKILGGSRQNHYVANPASQTDPFGLEPVSFFTVQGPDEIASILNGSYFSRDMANGGAWGNGLYTWETRAGAEAYRDHIQNRNPNLEILEMKTDTDKLSKLSSCCLKGLSQEAGDAFYEKYNRMWNDNAIPVELDHLRVPNQRFGAEHFFSDGVWQSLFLK